MLLSRVLSTTASVIAIAIASTIDTIPALAAVPCADYEETPQFLGSTELTSRPAAAAIIGDVAYVARREGGLDVVSLTGAPALLHDVPQPASFLDIVADGTTLYLANLFGGLEVWDALVPASPVHLSTTASAGYASAVAVDGAIAYVADRHAGIAVFDVSDPAAPTWLATLDVGGSVRSIAAEGGLVLAAGDFGRVSLVDVSDPAAPSLLWQDTYDLDGRAAILDGTRATVGGSADTNDDGFFDGGRLIVLDVSIPSSPAMVLDHESPVRYQDLIADGTDMWACSGATVYYIDASDASSVVDVPVANEAGGNVALARNGSDIWALSASTPAVIWGVDVTYAIPHQPVATLELGGDANDIVIDGDLAYLALDYSLAIADISDPLSPSLISTLSLLDGGAEAIQMIGTTVYVAGRQHLHVVDASNPADPVIVGTFEPLEGGSFSGIHVEPPYVYLADKSGGRGLLVVSVFNPAAPLAVGEIALDGAQHDIVVIDDVALMSVGNLAFGEPSHLEVVDVSDPTTPAYVDRVELVGAPRRLSLDGTRLYASVGQEGVQIVDVSDPVAPVVVEQVPTPGFAFHAVARDNLLYIADAWDGLRVASLLGTPSVLGGAIPGGTRHVAIGAEVLLTTADDELLVMPLQCAIVSAGELSAPPRPLLKVAPNPSAAAGAGIVTLSLPQRSDVVLHLFDVAGRRVRSIVDARLGAGTHRLPLNARGNASDALAPGVYFLHGRVAERLLSEKWVVVKP